MGQKVDTLLIDILEYLHRASFSQMPVKVALLGDVLVKVDSLRFFFQLCWELKLIPNKQFSAYGQDIEEIGKMVGGWRKGLIVKTSALEAEEKK